MNKLNKKINNFKEIIQNFKNLIYFPLKTVFKKIIYKFKK